jgi:hypothetical protein
MNNQVLVESKNIYTNTLVSLLQPIFYKYIKNIWTTCQYHTQPFKAFQDKLRIVQSWDSIHIKEFYSFCLLELQRNPDFSKVYLAKLLHVIFKLYINILNIVNDTLITSIQLPPNKQFFYICITYCCKYFYNSPFLFDTSKQRHSNHQLSIFINQRKDSIKSGILDTIQHFIPIKKILCDPDNIIVVTTVNDDCHESRKSDISSNSLQFIPPIQSQSQPTIHSSTGFINLL